MEKYGGYDHHSLWGNCPIGRGAYNDAVLTNTKTANLSNALEMQYSIGSNPISPTIPKGKHTTSLSAGAADFCPRPHEYAAVAQMEEHMTFNHGVGSSSLPNRTKNIFFDFSKKICYNMYVIKIKDPFCK